jgi:Tol biopolymer transport system component
MYRSNILCRCLIIVLSGIAACFGIRSITAAPSYTYYLAAITHSRSDMIAFTSTDNSEREVSIINHDGSGRSRLTYTPGFQSIAPTWSPDHTRLAYISNRDGRDSIYLMDTDGSPTTRIPLDLPANEPKWSPDGTRILFVGPSGLYIVKLDHFQLTQVTDPTEDAFNGSWSPDGTQIAYTVWQAGRRIIRIRDLNGSSAIQLANTPGAAYNPSWSPDGSRIAFASNHQNNIDLFTINIDGTGLRQLTNTRAYEYAPSWSPDGTQIAFTSYNAGSSDIWIINVDGTGLTLLTKHGDEPAWAR